MTTAVRPHARAAAAATTTGEPRPADVLVVFGITGDLAKQMTFRSLYRLECRGLLDCPIVGVAVDDWTVADLRERARTAIEATGEKVDGELFDRFAARLSYISGDFGDTGDLRAAGRRDPRRPRAGLLPRDPALPLRQRGQGPLRRGSHRTGRASSWRSRSATTSSRPVRWPPRCTSTSTSPSCTASTTSSGRWAWRRSSTCASPTQGSSRSGTATTSPRSRSRWPRASASRTAGISTTPSARCATSWSTTSCRWWAPPRWRCRPITRRPRSRTRCTRSSARCRRPIRPTTCAGSTTATARSRAWRPTRAPRPTPRCASTSTTGAGRACRSSSAPASACRSRRPSCAWSSSARRSWPSTPHAHASRSRCRSWSSSIRPPACGCSSRRSAAMRSSPSRSTSTWSSPTRAGRARRPTRSCCSPPCTATRTRFTRQDGVEEAWRVMQPLLDAPPPVHPYAKGSWGPAEADRLLAGPRPLARAVGRLMSAVDDKVQTAPQSAAAPSPVPADRRSTRSCRTATRARSSRPTAASAGSASRASTRRACSGRCSTARPGYFRLAPFGINVPSSRRYEPGTNVLETTWHTPSGWVVVRDALTMGPRRSEDTITPHTRPPTDDDAEHLLVRTVRCIDGSVEMELVCEPVFDYGRVPAEWALVGDDRHVADASGAEQTIRLSTDMALGIEGNTRARAPPAHRGRRALLRAVVGRGPRLPGRPRRRQRAAGADDALLAHAGSPAPGSPTTSG